MFLAGRLVNRFGARPLIVVGLICVFFGTLVTAHYSPQVDPWWIIWPILFQGFGLGLVFVPLATVSFATLAPGEAAEAAGVRQLARTIGGSLGVSVGGAVMANQTQTAWNQLGGHVTAFPGATSGLLNSLHLGQHSPLAPALLGRLLGHQAQFMGLLDAFYVMAWSVVIGLPLLFLIKRGAGR